jgi:hypothetical protein
MNENVVGFKGSTGDARILGLIHVLVAIQR